MPRELSLPTRWTQYLAARLAAMSLTAFEPADNLRTAAALGRGLFALEGVVYRRHRQRALAHLALAFPHLPPPRIEALARRSFEHLVQLAVEICHTPHALTAGSWPRHVRLGSIGPALEVLNAGRPVILITGHVGNWEVLGYLLALLGYRCEAIARPLSNPLIYDWLLGIRQRRGLRVITKWHATDRMLEVLGGGGALAFIADQNAGDKGLFVPFFGKLASTYKSIGLLAITQEAPIACGYAHRLERGYGYELGAIDVIHPRDWQGRRDPLYYVTARYMRAIETMIRRRPEQYLWMHRRWKSRPRHEREGKPLPAALRRNLEELPWMDEALLASVSQPPALRAL